MGLLDFLRRDRERFSSEQMNLSSAAFAAWLRGDDGTTPVVTPYTVIGLSAVLRSVWIISTTIAGLPLRTYEKGTDGTRARVDSVFDDPYPGVDGQTPFEWVETVLIHLLLWRNAYLWHDKLDRDGNPLVYRPILPDTIVKVERVGGRKRFTYKDSDGEDAEVGSEMITHIPGPSFDGVTGHPFLTAARAIFAGSLAGDRAAQQTLSRGIRLAGLLVPAEGEEIEGAEADTILERLRAKVLGSENAGDIAVINRRMELRPWTPTNIEMQWGETRQAALGEVERLFGMPPHLLADTEKQTSWGTGVAEQNLGLARYTLRGWSDRVDQRLSKRLAADQFCEFDYKGLLQGTPAEEIRLVIEQLNAGLISLEYATRVLNLPDPTSAQQAVTRPVALPSEHVA